MKENPTYGYFALQESISRAPGNHRKPVLKHCGASPQLIRGLSLTVPCASFRAQSLPHGAGESSAVFSGLTLLGLAPIVHAPLLILASTPVPRTRALVPPCPQRPQRRPLLLHPRRGMPRALRRALETRPLRLRVTLPSSPMAPCAALLGRRSSAHERREADGSLQVVYGASIRSCRPCPLLEQCQWQGWATAKPRQVSVLLHSLVVGSAPLRLSRLEPSEAVACLHAEALRPTGGAQSRSQPAYRGSTALPRRAAHWRLAWAERLARTARALTADLVTIRLFGIPAALATVLGLATA